RSAAGLLEVVDDEARHGQAVVALLRGAEAREGARALRAEGDAAEAVEAVRREGRDDAADDPPGRGEAADVVVKIRGPGVREQHEAVAGVPEARLELAAQRGGDEIAGDDGVTVVGDAGDALGLL